MDSGIALVTVCDSIRAIFAIMYPHSWVKTHLEHISKQNFAYFYPPDQVIGPEEQKIIHPRLLTIHTEFAPIQRLLSVPIEQLALIADLIDIIQALLPHLDQANQADMQPFIDELHTELKLCMAKHIEVQQNNPSARLNETFLLKITNIIVPDSQHEIDPTRIENNITLSDERLQAFILLFKQYLEAHRNIAKQTILYAKSKLNHAWQYLNFGVNKTIIDDLRAILPGKPHQHIGEMLTLMILQLQNSHQEYGEFRATIKPPYPVNICEEMANIIGKVKTRIMITALFSQTFFANSPLCVSTNLDKNSLQLITDTIEKQIEPDETALTTLMLSKMSIVSKERIRAIQNKCAPDNIIYAATPENVFPLNNDSFMRFQQFIQTFGNTEKKAALDTILNMNTWSLTSVISYAQSYLPVFRSSTPAERQLEPMIASLSFNADITALAYELFKETDARKLFSDLGSRALLLSETNRTILFQETFASTIEHCITTKATPIAAQLNALFFPPQEVQSLLDRLAVACRTSCLSVLKMPRTFIDSYMTETFSVTRAAIQQLILSDDRTDNVAIPYQQNAVRTVIDHLITGKDNQTALKFAALFAMFQFIQTLPNDENLDKTPNELNITKFALIHALKQTSRDTLSAEIVSFFKAAFSKQIDLISAIKTARDMDTLKLVIAKNFSALPEKGKPIQLTEFLNKGYVYTPPGWNKSNTPTLVYGDL
jgi:hypothetical protein